MAILAAVVGAGLALLTIRVKVASMEVSALGQLTVVKVLAVERANPFLGVRKHTIGPAAPHLALARAAGR